MTTAANELRKEAVERDDDADDDKSTSVADQLSYISTSFTDHSISGILMKEGWGGGGRGGVVNGLTTSKHITVLFSLFPFATSFWLQLNVFPSSKNVCLCVYFHIFSSVCLY